MRVETRETVIPAQTRVLTVYVANDGREIFHEDACQKWEQQLNLQEQHVFKTCIRDVFTLDDESATLYNIRNNEDYQILMSMFSSRERRNVSDDYVKHGPGWYIYFRMDGGDGPDFYHLWNYEAYVNDREAEIVRWKTTMSSKMAAVVT